MSLATRCTACGTVFRVVQDQLRVSEGWVRCGRCTEVFNAVENLVDPPTTAASSGGAALQDAALGRGPAPGSGQNGAPGTRAFPDGTDDPDDRYGASSLLPSAWPPDEAGAEGTVSPQGLGGTGGAGGAGDQAAGGDPGDASAPASPAGAPETRATQPLPSFVRQADRAARWQQPRVRAALTVLALVAGLGLLAQAAHSYRDLLAARWPAAQPLLAQACGLLSCTVQPPRLIDALVVDSSGLLQVERSNVYKLSVALRNQDVLTVALPALDLSLTDLQGRLVARRVLRMDELGHTQDSLAAGAELVLQATLQTPESGPGQAVAGYTIDLFYP